MLTAEIGSQWLGESWVEAPGPLADFTFRWLALFPFWDPGYSPPSSRPEHTPWPYGCLVALYPVMGMDTVGTCGHF